MIIEAGYDLHIVMFAGGLSPGALRMVCLNEELRVIDVTTVTPDFSGEFDATARDMIEMSIPDHVDPIPQLTTRYVALGYAVADASQYPHGFDWDRIGVLTEWLGCHGVQLLTVQVTDDEKWASSGPMHSFATYAGYDDLPRALVIPGPHPFGSCECAACATIRPPRDDSTADV